MVLYLIQKFLYIKLMKKTVKEISYIYRCVGKRDIGNALTGHDFRVSLCCRAIITFVSQII